MSETLLGVIIGGFIASIGTLVSVWSQHKKWKIENKIRILELRREKLEEKAEKILSDFEEGLLNNEFYSSMWVSLNVDFNKYSDEILEKYLGKENITVEDKRKALYFLDMSLKKTIRDIDDEINKLLK